MATIQASSLSTVHPAGRLSGVRKKRRTGSAYIANLPADPCTQGIVGYTPLLSELIDDALPVVWHLMDRSGISAALPVYLFYVNPRAPLADNATALSDLLLMLDGCQAVWVPVSTSHAAILHTLRLVMPAPDNPDLQQVHLLYIGDSANRRSMATIAADSSMPFAFHALY